MTRNLKQEIIQMLNNPPGDLYGVIVRKNGTLGVYWSPHQFNNPNRALDAHVEMFMYLGVEGWYPDREHKDIFEYFKNISPDWPQWPGEYVDLDLGRSAIEMGRVREWFEVAT